MDGFQNMALGNIYTVLDFMQRTVDLLYGKRLEANVRVKCRRCKELSREKSFLEGGQKQYLYTTYNALSQCRGWDLRLVFPLSP